MHLGSGETKNGWLFSWYILVVSMFYVNTDSSEEEEAEEEKMEVAEKEDESSEVSI